MHKNMKRILAIGLAAGMLAGCGDQNTIAVDEQTKTETPAAPDTKDIKADPNHTVIYDVPDKSDTEFVKYESLEEETEAISALYPAVPGAKLYDVAAVGNEIPSTHGGDFQDMAYAFSGKVVKIGEVPVNSRGMQTAYFTENDAGFIMPVIPPYLLDIKIGDQLDVWGSLSGNGYDLAEYGFADGGISGSLNGYKAMVNGVLE